MPSDLEKGDVRRVIEGLSAAQGRLVQTLRSVIRRAAPGVQESVVWNSISYHRPALGGRVKGSVCLVVAKPSGVRLDFIHGVRLADPARLLQGQAKSKRFIPIREPRDARRPAVAALIRKAASLTFPPPSQIKTPRRRGEFC